MKVEYGATAQMGERAAAELQPLTHNSAVEFEVETDASEGAMTFTFGGKVATFVLLSGAVVSMVTMPSMFQGASFGLDDSTMDLSSKMSQVTLKASNEYTEMHGYAGEEYDWLDSGSLVEPHKQTTLTASLPAGVSPSSVHMHWQAGSYVTSDGEIEAAESNDGNSWQIETVFPVPGQVIIKCGTPKSTAPPPLSLSLYAYPSSPFIPILPPPCAHHVRTVRCRDRYRPFVGCGFLGRPQHHVPLRAS
mmetsp:Transcript_99068/g.283440  ORF Transcript_99068/g.283440 Transcript_99068/m.283440 type:complete len:248 (-) Transcript_99068:550-1293(-)